MNALAALDERAHVDFETASPTDLRKSGVYRYAEDPNTLTWGFSYCIGHGPIKQWRPGYPDPVDLLDHIRAGGTVVAHNAAFERTIWNWYIRRRHCPHWPELKISQQSCTMARAAAMSYLQDLERLGAIIGLDQQKDVEGAALMKKMMRPRKINKDGTIIWWDEPENRDRVMTYCDQDVRTEREADDKLPDLTPFEHALWQFDQLINDRGIKVDVPTIVRATDMVTLAKRKADAEMARLTDGHVKKCTETGQIVEWLNMRGIMTTTFQKGDHDDILEIARRTDDKTAEAVVELRRSSGKTSVAKYDAMLECVCSDDRIRGLLNYHGAGPGRWAGRLVQPQNFPRVDYDHENPQVQFLVNYLSGQELPISEVYELTEMGIGKPLHWLSKSLRGMIIAEAGNKLIGGDFSNIEGRVNAWLAGEHWKLDAFRQYDLGLGPDLYKVAYGRSFGVELDTITKPQRQIGKVQELASGYQGGVGAYMKMGPTYNLKPLDLVAPAKEAMGAEAWDKTAARFAKATDKHGLDEEPWTAIKLIVTAWRAAHPAIVQSWWELGDAAVEAVDTPGTPVYVYNGRVAYLCVDGWLYCQLPSGRVICYAAPYVHETVVTLVNKDGEEYDRISRTVAFMGRDPTTGQWRRKHLYGGLQCENIVQGTARDLMAEAMFRVEGAGYPVILTVHDEILSEVRKDFGSENEYAAIMSVLPTWAEGLPVSVGAFEDERYVK